MGTHVPRSDKPYYKSVQAEKGEEVEVVEDGGLGQD
jgi:hypothetical protein